MASWFFRPVRRDRANVSGSDRDIRSKTIGAGLTGQAKRGTVFADKLPQTIRINKPSNK